MNRRRFLVSGVASALGLALPAATALVAARPARAAGTPVEAPWTTAAEGAGSGALVARGRFRDGSVVHRAAGNAMLERLPDGSHRVRLENFRVTSGPDLHVCLARHRDPADTRDVEQGYLVLGRLRALSGDQDYPVPPGTAVAEYGSVIVYCRLFRVLFAPATLVAVRRAADRPVLALAD